MSRWSISRARSARPPSFARRSFPTRADGSARLSARTRATAKSLAFSNRLGGLPPLTMWLRRSKTGRPATCGGNRRHPSGERSYSAPGLTVAEVLLLDRFADGRSGFFVSPVSIRRQAQAIAERSGFALPLDRDFGEIGVAERQLVGIARALSAQARVLILDEPTASLSSAEAARLFAVLEGLAARGLAILYISHRMGDLKRLTHRVAVLRGGRMVAEFRRPIDFSAALEAMIGRAVSSAHPRARTSTGPPVLELIGLSTRAGAPRIDLTLRAGEVTAITGPLGAGKSRL